VIITKLSGGLGNQLFQYAAGLAASRAAGRPLYCDLSWYAAIKESDTKREMKLAYLGLPVDEVTRVVRTRLAVQKYLKFCGCRFRTLEYIKDVEMGFDERIISVKGDAYLDGYWQSYRYSEGVDEELRKLLKSSRAADRSDTWKIRFELDKSESAGVHVRRGDYVTSPTASKIYAVPDIDYYVRAIARLRSMGVKRFLFFSDDIAWCAKSFGEDSQHIYVSGQGGLSDADELLILSACDHQIIANSTFSWWAAHLNARPDKHVIAPSKWFHSRQGAPAGLIPPTWIVM